MVASFSKFKGQIFPDAISAPSHSHLGPLVGLQDLALFDPLVSIRHVLVIAVDQW